MRKFLVLLCVVIMILGGVGCKKSGSSASISSSGLIVAQVSNPDSENGQSPASVPEPSTILLLGSGLIGLAGFGRKRFKK